jgi:hypothetical protein
VVDQTHPVEDHRFGGGLQGDVWPLRVVLDGLVRDISDAELIKHHSYKAEMVSGLTWV